MIINFYFPTVRLTRTAMIHIYSISSVPADQQSVIVLFHIYIGAVFRCSGKMALHLTIQTGDPVNPSPRTTYRSDVPPSISCGTYRAVDNGSHENVL